MLLFSWQTEITFAKKTQKNLKNPPTTYTLSQFIDVPQVWHITNDSPSCSDKDKSAIYSVIPSARDHASLCKAIVL